MAQVLTGVKEAVLSIDQAPLNNLTCRFSCTLAGMEASQTQVVMTPECPPAHLVWLGIDYARLPNFEEVMVYAWRSDNAGTR